MEQCYIQLYVMCCIPLLYRTEGNMTPTGAQEGSEEESVQVITESVDESLESGDNYTSVAMSPSTSVSLETCRPQHLVQAHPYFSELFTQCHVFV
jgi:hypothetical protein